MFITSPRDLKQLGTAMVRGRRGVGLAGVGVAGLLLWNGPLVASTGAGMGTMVLMYLLQDEEWRRKLPEVNEQVQMRMASWNRPFVWSVLAGGSAAFLSYLALSAWLETDSHWMATGILVQGLMTVGVLGLGVRQAIGRSAARGFDPEVKTTDLTSDLASWVQMLSHTDATARLLAVREMTSIGLGASLGEKKQVLEYFQLFLSQESEEMVRDAVWEGFERLGLDAVGLESVGLAGQRDLRLARGLEEPMVKRIGAVLENEELRVENRSL